jgi:hypothetical protein
LIHSAAFRAESATPALEYHPTADPGLQVRDVGGLINPVSPKKAVSFCA